MFEDLIPELQGPAQDLVDAAGAAGLQPRVTSTLRSYQAQVRLYRRWQSGLSPLPAAPPGTSAHEFGYAFDLVVTPYEALSDVGYTWQTWGGEWGGEKDPVHFQYPGFVPPVEPEPSVKAKIAGTIATLPLGLGASVGISAAQAIEGKPLIVDAPPLWQWTWKDIADPQGFFHTLSWLVK
jgi:D-alanyl-D-alanine carboxypeptidase